LLFRQLMPESRSPETNIWCLFRSLLLFSAK
jgi:hypothetical protein